MTTPRFYISKELADELLEAGLVENTTAIQFNRPMRLMYTISNTICNVYSYEGQPPNQDALIRILVLIPTQEARIAYLDSI